MKKIVSLSLLYFLVGTLLSCTKNNSPVLYDEIIIHYIDSSGYDLFKHGQNGYFRDSVQLLNLQNGNKNLIYIANSMYPYGYYFTRNILGGKVLTDSGTLIIGTYNIPVTNNYTTNIIHLKIGVNDTLKAHVNGINYDSIWYNGILKNDSITIKR